MEKIENSEKLNTAQKNDVMNNGTASDSFISQKQIADKANNSLSEFTVLSKSDFKTQDWIFKSKFLEINELLGSDPLEYPLKKTKGNPDEGQKPIDGKALRITMDKKIITIDVYTQKYGEKWSLSHTHQIAKNVFNAYALVVKNDLAVSELEIESKTPKNFSLNLG